jgi:capsular polysaccharide transport system permease protein
MASGTPEIESSLTRRVGIYEELAVDLEFLQRNYVSALASLEAARLEADRQQRYVATFVHSSLPQEPLYPRRELNCLIVFLCAVMGWGILTMVVYVVREHAI